MEYSFPRYLLAKQSVDDRALNKDVLAALRRELATFQTNTAPLQVIEVGAGIGTMLTRLLRWNVLPPHTDYTLVDEMPENIAFARTWLPNWAQEHGWHIERPSEDHLRLFSASSSVSIQLVQADVFDFIRASVSPSASSSASSVSPSASSSASAPADLLIAHAFLDLLPLPASLPPLFSLLRPGGLAWLTINFDGVTTFEPPFQPSASFVSPSASPSVDALLERLYHQTMDTRPTGGDSRSGRHLFGHLKQAGVKILAAGASDWVVYPSNGAYPAEEDYFLHFILHFFETSLAHHPELDSRLLEAWLKQRRAQIERAELVYIAHQIDFLIRR